MTLGLVYDVHGNLPALEAVLADASAAGTDAYLLGGDYSSFGAWPRDCLDRLRELDFATWLRGNWERWTAGDDGDAPADDLVAGALAAVRRELDESAVAELAALPQTVAQVGLRACHASPGSDMRSFAPTGGDDDAELLDGVAEPVVVFGHTHVQFARAAAPGAGAADARRLVNPGSVGLPFDGDPRAAYALRHDDGRFELRRVAYDCEASAAAVRKRFAGSSWAPKIAATIERGER